MLVLVGGLWVGRGAASKNGQSKSEETLVSSAMRLIASASRGAIVSSRFQIKGLTTLMGPVTVYDAIDQRTKRPVALWAMPANAVRAASKTRNESKWLSKTLPLPRPAARSSAARDSNRALAAGTSSSEW